jgi:hypothetical protein
MVKLQEIDPLRYPVFEATEGKCCSFSFWNQGKHAKKSKKRKNTKTMKNY